MKTKSQKLFICSWLIVSLLFTAIPSIAQKSKSDKDKKETKGGEQDKGKEHDKDCNDKDRNHDGDCKGQPDKTPNNDCGGSCFSTQVISAAVNDNCCTEYELRISHDGTCRYDLSHVTFEIPCGTISNLSNSRNWKQEIGKDPTTGLTGFKIDDIPSFGKDSDSSFTVKVTICGDSLCSEKFGAVAYKAATCVDYQTLVYEVNGSCDDGNGDGGDGGGSGSGGDDGNGDGGTGDGGGTDGGDNGEGGGNDGGSDTTQTCSTLLASIKIKGTTCYGSSDGSLTATIQDGKAPYTYRWSTGSTDSTAQNLSAGTYYVTITDANGNVLTLTEAVTQPNEIIITESTLNASCNGVTNGSIDISASGGAGMYTYLWSTGATSEDVINLKAGTYSVTITDTAACTKQKSYTLTNENKITLTGSVTKTGCSQSTGAVNLTASGGTSPYTFVWSNGATTEDIQNLSAGSYKVTATDAGGCSAQATFVITENNTVRVSSSVTAAGCSNEAIGAIDISVTGGTAPYTYSWQHGATTEDVSGLVSGIYRVTVTDNLGCSIQTAINVPKKTIQVSTDIIQPLCHGDSTGSITVTPVDGTNTYTYSWSNGETDNTLTNVPVGSYSVTITDPSGCTRTLTYAITQPSAITASTTVTNTQCGDEGSFAIDLSVSGGKSPYTYLWSNGATTQDLQNLNSGNYSVTIKDFNGCTSLKNITIDPVVISWSCLIDPPSYELVCNSAGNLLGTSVTDANQYMWSVSSSDNSWTITSDPSNAAIAYTAGNTNTTATFNLTIVKDGCTKTCSYVVSSSCSVRDNTGGGDPSTGDPCATDTVVVNDSTITAPITEPTAAVNEEETTEINMSVYPNPFESTMNFEWVATKDEVVRLEILDALGRPLTEVFIGRVHKGETYKFDWTGAGLKDRMYFYRYSCGNKSIYGKVFRK